ncbi:hypothetical protein AB833_00645 [Chromatiales bacterium (ex Bugula neritina AB1)]|nr:hypothetical protein AB833_00645 [Chromatiales bacterium (ex Bugula neritina AB1)]
MVRARDTPYLVKVAVFDSGLSIRTSKELVVDHIRLLDILLRAAYNNSAIKKIPLLIDELHHGNVQSLRKFAEDYWHIKSSPDFSEVLSWSIYCREQIALEDNFLEMHLDSAPHYSTKYRFGQIGKQQIFKALNVGIDNSLQAVNTFETKTVIIAGSLDPIVSDRYVTATASNFSNATILTVPGMGHAVWHQSKCTRKNIVMFFSANDSRKSAKLRQCKDGIHLFE